jgi:hypothetical protein
MDNMKKESIIFEETRVLTAKYCHPKSDDYLHYISKIKVQNSALIMVSAISHGVREP